MIRKGFIDNEITRLAEIMAKVLRLKNEGQLEEAENLSREVLEQKFSLSEEMVLNQSAEEFIDNIKQAAYSSEKLNMLAQFLFELVYPFEETKDTANVLNKAAGVLNYLETEHHQTSLDNINRRTAIEKFLNNRQYE